MRSIRRLRPHPQQTYLLLGLLFGVLWFVLVVGLYVAGIFGQYVAFLTVPNIVIAQLLLRPIGRFERLLVTSLLGQAVPEPRPLPFERSTGAWSSPLVNIARRSLAAFQDGHSWRVLVWVLVRVIIGPLGFLLVILPVLLLLAPLMVVVDAAIRDISMDAAWTVGLLVAPVALVALRSLRWAARALADLHRRLAVWALGPGRNELLAAALARAAHAEERVRIDQELHDSIGHMLSMIVVQAGAGAHVFDKDPEFARRALGTIEQRGRAALGELDRIIADIHDNIPAGAVDGRHEPLPDGQALPALIAGTREAGMTVSARIHIKELPPVIGRGVYRIVQEALTNAAKHAPGAAVRVDVAASEDAVAISVVNAHRRTSATPRQNPGRGLASIRDRAALLGGHVSVGPTDRDEFVVRAVIPLVSLPSDGPPLTCSFMQECTCLGCTTRRKVLG